MSYLQYSVQALVINEVENLHFFCPNNAGAIPVPIPTNAGSVTKYFCRITSGQDLMNQYNMIPGMKWGGFGALYGMYLVFIILGIVGLRFVNHQKR